MGQSKHIPSGGREGERMQRMGSGDASFRTDSYQNSLVQKQKFLCSFTIPTSSNFEALLCSEHYAVCLGGSIGMHMARCLVHTAERQSSLVERAQAKDKFTGGVTLGQSFKSSEL